MIRISQIRIDASLNQEDNLEKYILKKIHIRESDLKNYKIIKRSIDARNKNQIFYVYIGNFFHFL